MNNKGNALIFPIILTLLLAFFLFALGVGLGMVFYAQQKNTQTNCPANSVSVSQVTNGNLKDVFTTVTSKTILSITVAGKVSKISGNSVTIASTSDSQTIKMANNAVFYRSVTKNGKTSNTKITLKNVKIGEYVVIVLVVNNDSTIKGESLFIPIPAAAKK